MPILTGNNPRLLKPGIQALFGLWYKQWPELYSQVFDVMQSDNNFEEYVNVNGLGMPYAKPESTPAKYGDMDQKFIKRAQNITYALGFIVSWEAQMDNKYPQVIKAYVPALARSMKQAKETIAFNVLNNGFSTATAADGVAVFSTSHKKSKGGNYSNTMATAADFSEAAYEQALIDIDGFQDDAGMKLMAQAKLLVYPKEIQYDVTRVVKNPNRPGTADRDINATYMDNNVQLLKSVYLDDPDAWFIKTDVTNGLIFQHRYDINISEDNEFDTKNHKWLALERYCALCCDARGVYGVPGA